MTTVTRTSGARATQTLTAANKALVDEISGRNRKAKLGSFSIRFQVPGSSKELTPREAIETLARKTGEKVTATLVTWKTFRGGHKLAPTERKVRTKVRGVEPKTIANVGEFEKAWMAMEKKANPRTRIEERPRSTHPTKRN
jgi:hypothetical protein